jgi:hypothetical protein
MRYTLQDFMDITFQGFQLKLPDDTLTIINEIASKVGSPTYIKTPVFLKKEHPVNNSATPFTSTANTKRNKYGHGNSHGNSHGNTHGIISRGKMQGDFIQENMQWENVRSFQPTKIEKKEGVDVKIDLIRSSLNKMTNKNYDDQVVKITDILDTILTHEEEEDVNDINDINDEDMIKIGNIIFEIASNNRFYSKLYADLYSVLMSKYDIMKIVFDKNVESFLTLFQEIEYINPEKDYDKFCSINKINERRKALSLFLVNLTLNNILPFDKLSELLLNLMTQILTFIKEENKNNEVDEIIENVVLLYNKQIFTEAEAESKDKKICIDSVPLLEVIQNLANIKSNQYPSLSKKSIFKFGLTLLLKTVKLYPKTQIENMILNV